MKKHSAFVLWSPLDQADVIAFPMSWWTLLAVAVPPRIFLVLLPVGLYSSHLGFAQVVEELLAAAGLAATLPVAVPGHHYEEPDVEWAPGAKMHLSAALSKGYDLRCVFICGQGWGGGEWGGCQDACLVRCGPRQSSLGRGGGCCSAGSHAPIRASHQSVCRKRRPCDLTKIPRSCPLGRPLPPNRTPLASSPPHPSAPPSSTSSSCWPPCTPRRPTLRPHSSPPSRPTRWPPRRTLRYGTWPMYCVSCCLPG